MSHNPTRPHPPTRILSHPFTRARVCPPLSSLALQVLPTSPPHRKQLNPLHVNRNGARRTPCLSTVMPPSVHVASVSTGVFGGQGKRRSTTYPRAVRRSAWYRRTASWLRYSGRSGSSGVCSCSRGRVCVLRGLVSVGGYLGSLAVPPGFSSYESLCRVELFVSRGTVIKGTV